MRHAWWLLLGAMVASCALTIQYDDYQRVSADAGPDASGVGASSGFGGGTFGGGTAGVAGTVSGGAGGVAGAVSGGGTAGGGGCGNEGEECAPPACVETTYTEYACSSGLCEAASKLNCYPYECTNTGCLTACVGTNQCVPFKKCSNGSCVDCATCGEKYGDPSNAKNSCAEDSEQLWSELRACCGAVCQNSCTGPGGLYAVCNGPSSDNPDAGCQGCLQTNCPLEFGFCQSDAAEP